MALCSVARCRFWSVPVLRYTGRPYRVDAMKAADIQRIRAKLELSQSEFAELLGISVRTLQDWEQGRYAPGAAAVRLLELADSGRLKRIK